MAVRCDLKTSKNEAGTRPRRFLSHSQLGNSALELRMKKQYQDDGIRTTAQAGTRF